VHSSWSLLVVIKPLLDKNSSWAKVEAGHKKPVAKTSAVVGRIGKLSLRRA
jgi:hypothetical protein